MSIEGYVGHGQSKVCKFIYFRMLHTIYSALTKSFQILFNSLKVTINDKVDLLAILTMSAGQDKHLLYY